MKSKFLAHIATIISTLATEASEGKSVVDLDIESLTDKLESDSYGISTQTKTPFVLFRSEDSVFIAAHRSHSSHSSHSSHYSGSSGGSSYSPSYSTPSYSSPSTTPSYDLPTGPDSTSSTGSHKYNSDSSPSGTSKQIKGFQANITKCRLEESDFHYKVLATDYETAEKMWATLKNCLDGPK